jgi:hypothetical protein
VERAHRALAEACQAVGRDVRVIRRSQWIFTRVARAGERPDRSAALAGFRRLNPWFARFPDAEVEPALVVGDAGHCATRLQELTESLALDLPVIDLSGLDADSARRNLEAIPAGS